MSIIHRPRAHVCDVPRSPLGAGRYPRGTIYHCEKCDTYCVADGNAHWYIPFPWSWSRANRIIREHRRRRGKPE